MDGALKAAIGAIAAVFLLTLISLAGILLVLTGGGASLTGKNGSSGGSGSAVNCIPDTSPIGTPDPTATPINNGCGPGEVPAPLPSGGSLVGFRQDVADAIEAAAAKYGVNPCLLGAIAMQESSGNPNAISPDGGYGLFQITLPNKQPWDPNWANPTVNSDKGAATIASALNQYGGNLQQGLTYYNCGGRCGDPPNPQYTTGTVVSSNPPYTMRTPSYMGCVPNGTSCLSYPDNIMRLMNQVCPNGTDPKTAENITEKILANNKYRKERISL